MARYRLDFPPLLKTGEMCIPTGPQAAGTEWACSPAATDPAAPSPCTPGCPSPLCRRPALTGTAACTQPLHPAMRDEKTALPPSFVPTLPMHLRCFHWCSESWRKVHETRAEHEVRGHICRPEMTQLRHRRSSGAPHGSAPHGSAAMRWLAPGHPDTASRTANWYDHAGYCRATASKAEGTHPTSRSSPSCMLPKRKEHTWPHKDVHTNAPSSFVPGDPELEMTQR